jgi:phosphohistidine phosphatase
MTVRRLVLLRHAKAESPAGQADLDRRLTDRGQADAGSAGAWLCTHGYQPDLVICSPAKRTRQTWHAVAAALTEAPAVHYERRAYTGDAADLLTLVQAVPDEVGTLLLVGHNPTVSELSAILDPEAGGDSDGLRTCTLAVHAVPGSWAACGPQAAPLAARHTARA